MPRDSTTMVKRWKFQIAPGVTTFSFTVLVSAEVIYPEGYIDGHPYVLTLNPGETRTLSGSVFNAVGTLLNGQTISWSSDAPDTASVSGSQVTAGQTQGFATITATSGARPGVFTTAVSVCPSMVVGDGTSLQASLLATDCFSSYGSSNGQTSTTYYGDLYRVSLTAGQTMVVTMDSDNALDPYLLLADANLGFLVAANDDDEDIDTTNSRMVYTATATGVYVIEATSFDARSTGNYTLGVTIS
jgi:hypothetical protein